MDDALKAGILEPWQLVIFAAVFGAMWGSFANVVIARWPLGLSVVRPASHCMACGTPIRFYDNIPILSYFILRGRCRSCKAKFSIQYLLVESVMAMLSVGVLNITLLAGPPSLLFGLAEYFIWFAFVWALLTAGIIDLATYLLPDAITLTGIAVGLLVNIFVFKNDWFQPFAGAVGGYAFLSLVFVHGYRLLTGRRGMGEGDPKLLAMVGAFLGFKGAAFTLFVGAFQGLIIGSILVAHQRKKGLRPQAPKFDTDDDSCTAEDSHNSSFRKAMVPFGPFLALGAMEYLFFGDYLIELYQKAVLSLVG